jgi:predicted nucleotidyltransferase
MENNQKLNEIVRKFDICLLLTFGSYKTDRYTKHSDIDVAYMSARSLEADEELELLKDIVIYFGRDGIDLVDLKKSDPLLSFQIACNSKVLYEEDNKYLLFKIKASAMYADTKYLRELRRKFLREKLRSYN